MMKTIMLSADEHLIEAAEKKARSEHTTLDEQFRMWLEGYIQKEAQVHEAANLIHQLQQYARTGGQHFTRDEMNER